MKQVESAAQEVHMDVSMEARNRHESIEHIKACLKGDFPKLEELIKRELEEKADNQMQIEEHLDMEMNRVGERIAEERNMREETENSMVDMFKEMVAKIK